MGEGEGSGEGLGLGLRVALSAKFMLACARWLRPGAATSKSHVPG